MAFLCLVSAELSKSKGVIEAIIRNSCAFDRQPDFTAIPVVSANQERRCVLRAWRSFHAE
jgi:hypothetical protein